MQTIALTSIMQQWAVLLTNNTAIKNFCQEKYAKDPTVYLGYSVTQPLTVQNYPCIVVSPIAKKEGLEEQQYTYRVAIEWFIENETRNTVIPGIVKYVGLEEADTLGQLIWETVAEASPQSPVARLLYELKAMDLFPQISGLMTLKMNVTPSIGGQIQY
jgi:hypothetical protein